jgi:hypothetical protein
MLHAFALLVAASTALLIFAGGLVTSTGSGLSVPDWPNSYGWFMFTFPVENWVGGIFYEHSHRLIASTVGFLILVMAFVLWRWEPRAWVRRLGFIALGAVVTQGILGGITVLWYLPDPISIAHASLAQLVFCGPAIALATSGMAAALTAEGCRTTGRCSWSHATRLAADRRGAPCGTPTPAWRSPAPWAFGRLVRQGGPSRSGSLRAQGQHSLSRHGARQRGTCCTTIAGDERWHGRPRS